MGTHCEGAGRNVKRRFIAIMNFIRRNRRSILVTLLSLILITPFVLAVWSGLEIASPPRRELMDYHREYLTYPETHGIHIDSFITRDGTPCLVCSPSGKAGERGLKIRKQLEDRGVPIPAFGKIVGTLVLCHGRKGRKEDYLPIAERFCAAGFRCVIPDLPAHGDHPDDIATFGIRESTLPTSVLYEASRKFGFDPQAVGLMGLSMGGSVAMHAADLPDAPWKALVVVSSFDSLASVVNEQACKRAGKPLGSLWAKTSAMVYHQKTGIRLKEIQPRNHAMWLSIPTLIAHGTADRVVPITNGKRLFAALPASTTKKWVEIPGADHDNVLITDFPIYSELAEWMLRNVPTR
jgi:pimeloyl-ACP methyl ester carboxylesterase